MKIITIRTAGGIMAQGEHIGAVDAKGKPKPDSKGHVEIRDGERTLRGTMVETIRRDVENGN
jgi:hypothetical protein